MEKSDKFNLALDKVLERFGNQEFLAQDYNEYSNHIRNDFYRKSKLWNNRNCCYPGCDKKAIKKSHSIPRSSVLKNISSDSHVLAPVFDPSNGYPQIQMHKIGLKNASVFPGYCKQHENLFQIFEKDGKIDNQKSALLQLYRTLSRERVTREIESQIIDYVNTNYKDRINREALSYLKDLLKKFGFDLREFNFKDFSIKGFDYVINMLLLEKKIVEEPNHFIDIVEAEILFILHNKPTRKNFFVKVLNIDFHFPIAMCGFGNQTYSYQGKKQNMYLLQNIIPLENNTCFIYAGINEEDDYLEKFCNKALSSPLHLLNLVESFMVNGSDHWFINPRYWQEFTTEKQFQIMYDILLTNNSFIDTYPFSIFDDIREKLISTFLSNIPLRGYPISVYEQNFINLEREKLKNINYTYIQDKDRLTDLLYEQALKYRD